MYFVSIQVQKHPQSAYTQGMGPSYEHELRGSVCFMLILLHLTLDLETELCYTHAHGDHQNNYYVTM